MPILHVSPLDGVEAVLANARPVSSVSLVRLPKDMRMPAGLKGLGEGWLHLSFDDVEEPIPGKISPDDAAISALIDFFDRRRGRGPMLIHCFQGVSRSAAAALILLAMSAPGHEREQAGRLYAAMPFARPNRLMLGIADRLLGLRGLLSELAIERNRLEPPTAAWPISLPLRHG